MRGYALKLERRDVRDWAATARGRDALAGALLHAHWAEQRRPPPFLTWMALAWRLQPAQRIDMIRRRRRFVEKQLERERGPLAAFEHEPGSDLRYARAMVGYAIRSFEMELGWLTDVERDFGHARQRPSSG